VLPPKEGRDRSFQFFSQLGSALRAMGMNEYGELYAFDDGSMPQYELPQLPGKPVPFYGLQDVTRIEKGWFGLFGQSFRTDKWKDLLS
jgi:hypothetical protein